MLSRADDWVWDSWFAVEDDTIHAFTLTAPRALGDPELRHINARIGHSISPDGITWTHLPDALRPTGTDSFDAQATWTGCVVKVDDLWHMFYTGINRDKLEREQAIGHAVSPDLNEWSRVSSNPAARATNAYAVLGNQHDGSEHFRDPWVFRHDGAWHMLITATDPAGWGTIGHATSDNLVDWIVGSPLVSDSGFRQIEVTQTICLDGRWFLLFCAAESDVLRHDVVPGWGTYCAPADGPTGPFHLDKAELFAPNVYAGRAVNFRNEWVLLGFLSDGTASGFEGAISNPLPMGVNDRGLLEIQTTNVV